MDCVETEMFQTLLQASDREKVDTAYLSISYLFYFLFIYPRYIVLYIIF